MVRLADWPRNPYLNEELHEWVRLHLDALGVDDVAVYATTSARGDDERRILVVTEVGLLDGWYAPKGSTARFSLSVRLYPWQAVHGVDLRGETFRLWAHEHQSRWRLRLATPALDTIADTPELGRALTQFAAACSVMAEPAGAAEVPADLPATPAGLRAPESAQASPAAEEPAFAEPEAQTPPSDGKGAPPMVIEERSLEEVVATIGDIGPLPARPPMVAEPEVDHELGPQDERSHDLARRLGLR